MASVRPARLADVPAVHGLLADFAREGILLARPVGEIYENVRDFLVAEEGATAVGCVALHIINDRLAEVRSLAVARAAHGKGVGRALVEAAMAEASGLGLVQVFCLTYQVDFFARLGFTKVDRGRLPEKIWGDCVRCDRFLACDEVAMWRDLPGKLPS